MCPEETDEGAVEELKVNLPSHTGSGILVHWDMQKLVAMLVPIVMSHPNYTNSKKKSTRNFFY